MEDKSTLFQYDNIRPADRKSVENSGPDHGISARPRSGPKGLSLGWASAPRLRTYQGSFNETRTPPLAACLRRQLLRGLLDPHREGLDGVRPTRSTRGHQRLFHRAGRGGRQAAIAGRLFDMRRFCGLPEITRQQASLS